MKLIATWSSILLFIQLALAQPPDTLWTRYLGGAADEYGDAILRTTDGGFVVSGSTNSYTGDLDFYLAKLSADGQLLWERAYGDSVNFEACTALVETADGGFLLGGYILTFTPFHTDAKLIKTDAEGEVVLDRTIGFPDSLLTIFACGERDDGYWIAGKAQIEELSKGFLFFLDHDFEIVAQYYFQQNSLCSFSCGERLADGGYILAGATFASDISPSDVIVVRYSAGGTVLWNRTFGDSGDDLISSVSAVESGGFILGGLTTSFNDENGSFYAIRLSDNGDSLWSRIYGDPNEEDHGHEIISTADGGFLFCGHSHDHHGNEEQISIFKLDQSGNVQWQLLDGTGDTETTESIVETAEHGFAICVTVLSDVESARMFAARYGPTNAFHGPDNLARKINVLQNYPNPFNGNTTIRYEIAAPGPLQIQLFNSTGQLVSVLHDGVQTSGLHELIFDASGLASGTYICRLTSKSTSSIPLILLK
jgi:hypothetical protein